MSHERSSTSFGRNLMAEMMVKERNQLLKENYDLYIWLLAQNVEWQSDIHRIEQSKSSDDSTKNTSSACTCCVSVDVNVNLDEKLKEYNRLLKENNELCMTIIQLEYATRNQ